MKKLFCYSPFVFLVSALISCGGGDETTGGVQKEYITESAPEEDTTAALLYDAFDADANQDLVHYFSPELLNDLNAYVHHFREMKTEKEFESNYREGLDLFERMHAELNDPVTDYLIKLEQDYEYWQPVDVILDDLQKYNGQLGPMEISCAAECSELDFLYALDSLTEKAQSTKGKADNQFMDLLAYIEGPFGYAGYPGFKVWYEQTWDLGGMSLLGEGKILEALERLIALKKATSLFDLEIEKMREDIYNDLAWGYTFKYSQEEILGEMDQILELNFFEGTELRNIQDHYKQIQAGGEPYDFNCKEGDCAFG